MPTNNIKHRMIIEARKISATIFEDRIEYIRDGSQKKEYIVPASVVRNDYINWILENHPEFDEDEFKRMIKTFEKSKSEVELVENDL